MRRLTILTWLVLLAMAVAVCGGLAVPAPVASPAHALPKSGGPVRGIGEKAVAALGEA